MSAIDAVVQFVCGWLAGIGTALIVSGAVCGMVWSS